MIIKEFIQQAHVIIVNIYALSQCVWFFKTNMNRSDGRYGLQYGNNGGF